MNPNFTFWVNAPFSHKGDKVPSYVWASYGPKHPSSTKPNGKPVKWRKATKAETEAACVNLYDDIREFLHSTPNRRGVSQILGKLEVTV